MVTLELCLAWSEKETTLRGPVVELSSWRNNKHKGPVTRTKKVLVLMVM